jgi:3-oxoacyl-[acyl-carrier protein] reductase
MDLGLKGKVALVTGAGSQTGFGKGIAMTLAKEGCDVIILDKNFDGAKKTASEIEGMGRKALAFLADLTSSAEVNAAVQKALAQFGRIDILVNNAGQSTPPKAFIDKTEAEWEPDININLKSVLIVTKAVLPQMIERKSGKIVNISSGVGTMGLRCPASTAPPKPA